ncbi:MAG: ATP synthase F1 subunit delta [Halobacteriovoraceae bacterium]|jgi:F-type H+-transporting ATPase subunit delta|nr:ATP synthase F1 subunit delta [Halobacteriovoraceae bacterium]
MKNKNIAKVYANTLIELGKEKNVDVAKELTVFTEVINSSNDLENVLFLDVFTNEEKEDVFTAIAGKLSMSEILVAAIKYLINEKRISLLPLIIKEVIIVDDEARGFMKGTIEGAEDDISQDHKDKLITALKKELGSVEAVLEYKKNDSITAGYKVTVGDLQLDATVDNQLKSFRDSILGN